MKKLTMVLALVAFTAMPVMAATPAPVPQPELPQSTDLTDQEACEPSLETLVTPASVNMASCPDGARAYYYSDASHSTQVGTCWHACCQLWSCTGEITHYYTVFTWPCDFN